jgi:hypothetical protein
MATVWGGLGAWIVVQKRRVAVEGVALGLLFGPLGVLVEPSISQSDYSLGALTQRRIDWLVPSRRLRTDSGRSPTPPNRIGIVTPSTSSDCIGRSDREFAVFAEGETTAPRS